MLEIIERPVIRSGVAGYVQTAAGLFCIEQDKELLIRRRHRSRFPIDVLKVGEGFNFSAEDIATVRSLCGYRKRRFGERYRVCRTDIATARCMRLS